MSDQPKASAMTDPAAIASEFANTNTQYALLAQEVSSGFKAIEKGMGAFTVAQKDQADRMERLMAMIHEVQLKSSGFERVFGDISSLKAEFTQWRANHEAENKLTADAVTQFKGAIKSWSMLGGLVVLLATALASYAVDRRFAQIDEQIRLMREQAQSQDKALDDVRDGVTELKATRGAR